MSRKEKALELIAAGWSNQQIADALGLSFWTVRNYRARHMPPEIDEEWERAVYRLFGGKNKDASLDP